MRILHVVSSLGLGHGGPSKAVPELCSALVQAGHEVTLYTTDLDVNGHLDVPVDQAIRGEDGVERWYFSTQRSGLYGVSLSLVRALRANLRDFDIVQIHSLYRFSSTIAAYYCRRYGIPYIVFPHGSLDPFLYYRHRWRKNIYELLFERRNLAKAAAVQFTADDELRLAASVGMKFRGVIVPYGMNITAPPDRDELREAFRSEWPVTRDKKVILFLSRVNFKKGLDLLVKAFGNVARARSDVHLFLAGPDDEGYGEKVRRWLAEEGVLDRATFAGMLLDERKAAAFAAADVFVLCSYTENFGIAIAEALAAGVPTIISNKVNIWRELRDAQAGLVVNCDADELTQAILTLLDDATLRDNFSKAGKSLVAEKFNWPSVAARLTTVYRDVIAGSKNHCPTETPLT